MATVDPHPLVLAGGHILSLEGPAPRFERADVVIDGGLITRVGRPGADDGWVGEPEVLDLTGMCILPGLVDLHFHTALGKGRFDDLRLDRWIEAWWYPVLRAMDPETAYWAGMLAYADALRSGTTCVNDMSRQLPALAQAAVDVGLRVVLANTIIEPGHGLDGLQDTVNALDTMPLSPLVEVRVGIEWMPFVTRELLRDARALADERGLGLHVHVAESREEVELTEARFGLRPCELAYECGLLGPDCVAAHGVWLSDGEIAMLAETATFVSHNPSSNAKLGNGVARLPEMLAAGITVGLGHDAAECNNSRDLFEVMKFTSLIHRATQGGRLPPRCGRGAPHGHDQRGDRPGDRRGLHRARRGRRSHRGGSHRPGVRAARPQRCGSADGPPRVLVPGVQRPARRGER